MKQGKVSSWAMRDAERWRREIKIPSLVELRTLSAEQAARVFHDAVFEVLEQYERLVADAGLGSGSHARAALAEAVRSDLLERFKAKGRP